MACVRNNPNNAKTWDASFLPPTLADSMYSPSKTSSFSWSFLVLGALGLYLCLFQYLFCNRSYPAFIVWHWSWGASSSPAFHTSVRVEARMPHTSTLMGMVTEPQGSHPLPSPTVTQSKPPLPTAAMCSLTYMIMDANMSWLSSLFCQTHSMLEHLIGLETDRFIVITGLFFF